MITSHATAAAWPSFFSTYAPRVTRHGHVCSSCVPSSRRASIQSPLSPEADNKTVHLTVKVLREPMRGAAEGRTKEGICSTQLGALAPGMSACVFVRSSASTYLPT